MRRPHYLRIADSIGESLSRLSACYDDLVKLQSSAATHKNPDELVKNLAALMILQHVEYAEFVSHDTED